MTTFKKKLKIFLILNGVLTLIFGICCFGIYQLIQVMAYMGSFGEQGEFRGTKAEYIEHLRNSPNYDPEIDESYIASIPPEELNDTIITSWN